MLVYMHNWSSLNTIPTSTHPKVRVHVYKINLLLDAIKYLSTGSPKRGVVQRVRHSLRRTLLLAVETLFLQALSSRSFLFGTRAGMAPSRRVCSAIPCVPWWFATSEWCMTDYWENANWKPISLKPLGMKGVVRVTTVPQVEQQAELSRQKKNSMYFRVFPTGREDSLASALTFSPSCPFFLGEN